MKRSRILILAGGMFLMAGCFAEDYSFCPPDENVRLLVKTDYEVDSGTVRGPAKIDWYEDQIDGVVVFVFDENENYVTNWEGGAYTLGVDYVVPLTLPEGHTYHYVAWTNTCRDEYRFSHWGDALHGGLTMADMTMNLVCPQDGALTEDIPHSHYGVLVGAAVADGSRVTDHVIVVNPRTYKINYIVRGLSTQDTYRVRADDYNRKHTFWNCANASDVTDRYYHERTLTETVTTRAVSSEISASMIMLQIGDRTDTSFDITNSTTGTSLYSGGLLETIRDHYDLTDAELTQMIDNIYEYDIILTFNDGNFVNIEVSTPTWNPVDVIPGIFD